MRQLVTFAVLFQRNKDSEWEECFYVGRGRIFDMDRGHIFDMDCQLVEAPIWDYRDRFHRGFAIFREDPAL